MSLFSKNPIGRLISFIITKSKSIRLSLVIFGCFILFSVFPHFTGSGLSSAEPMQQYLNGAFPNSLYQGNGLYRVAFPNLTFNVPIVFETIPNQNKIVVAELFGEINWFSNDETTTDKNTIIDLTNQVGVVWDGGLLGMTFHPRFDDPINPANYMYVYYSSKDRDGGREPEWYSFQACTNDDEYGGFLVLERYTVDPVTLVADVNSRTKLIVMKLFGYTHRGGGLTFGDDGFLYLTIGDQAAWSKAQEITNGLDGGLLRLDVDMQGGSVSHPPVRKLQDNLLPGINYNSNWFTNNTGPHPSDGSGGYYTNVFSGVNYYIPNDNPFLSPTGDVYEEYYAIGFRSPHRLTKDKLTGDLYFGDVGLYSYDEVNLVMAGKNYGWPIYEGNFNGGGSSGCSTMYNNMPHESPLTAFSTAEVNSIIGGYVYRGNDIPEYYGKYICADYGFGDEIIMVDTNTGDYEILGNFEPQNIISLGQDYDGELYLLNQDFGTNLYRLTSGGPQYSQMPQTLSETGAFEVSANNLFEGQFSDLIPTEGIVPYELIESFWSDGAHKQRWLAVPNGGDGSHDGPLEQVAYSENGDWDFPVGTVLIKHFELNTDKTNPNQRKKIETRFSIKGDNGSFYFLSYNWNDDETDAVLQEVGIDEDIEITTITGQTENQTWTFLDQSQCIACHNQANNGGLGLKSRYLNSDFMYDDDGTPTMANQLVTLSSIGILDTQITDANAANILTHKAISNQSATIEERARSYLDLNCAYCHRSDNVDNRGEFDLRLFNNLDETGLLSASVLTPLGIAPDEEIIFQGNANKSILFHRMDSTDPTIMMPPLAKSIVDTPAVNLIEAWINQLNTLSTVDNLLEELKVFVDYSNETVNIVGQVDAKTIFTLYNLQGRITKTEILKPNYLNYSIDVADLSSGVYFVKLTSTNNKKQIQKIIVH
ncbi:PQQ-dependent sugar dehydrogenase [Winogradskyella sp.]|uniref:PQQ-dependent sugar dehydrogenase n=1 Tax=Winogradskyella sp. TaxID=1883156 RepID=UPI00261DEBCE|nr:PQQ-dependent sugar dehydrogenase [Winogradskyella sp.]